VKNYDISHFSKAKYLREDCEECNEQAGIGQSPMPKIQLTLNE